MTPSIAVTTCYRPAPAHLARARVVSERFQAPLVERRAWEPLWAELSARGIEMLYVVARKHDEVRVSSGERCFVQEGLLTSKLGEGARHPFIRAVSGGEPVESVVDCTLGLANDALHLACALRCRITGIEGSPVMHTLLEEGVLRFQREHPEAAPIELRGGDATDVLRTMDAGSADVVVLDPMMSRAKKSAPSFTLLRRLAVPDRASPELLAEAARVAKKRVVLKLGRGAPLPQGAPYPFERREDGSHVIYWIHDT